jgi:hypothetical protein
MWITLAAVILCLSISTCWGCDPRCSCTLSGRWASCSGLGLDTIPNLGGVRHSLEMLIFRGNAVNRLTTQELSNFPNLQILDIRYQRGSSVCGTNLILIANDITV